VAGLDFDVTSTGTLVLVSEWTIRDLANASGVTSRTLRHYEQIGLLLPSRVGYKRYRFYGEAEVARLYRILSLRELGLPLTEIKNLLDTGGNLDAVLREHRQLLTEQLSKLLTRIALLDGTIQGLEKGKTMDIKTIFNTFDHNAHEAEVRERWGAEAWETAEARRENATAANKDADLQKCIDVNTALQQAAENGIKPESSEFQQLIADHYQWVADQWGGVKPTAEAYCGLADMYSADQRFTDFYGGMDNAKAITSAIKQWAANNL